MSIPIRDAIRAVELAIADCDAATPGQWHFMNHRGDGEMRCDCHAIMGEGNAGSLFQVSSNLGIEILRDGSNDSPAPNEAVANADFVVLARVALRPMLEYLLRKFQDCFSPDIQLVEKSVYADIMELHKMMHPLIARYDATRPGWREESK